MKPEKVTIAHCWAQKRVNKVAMLSKYTGFNVLNLKQTPDR